MFFGYHYINKAHQIECAFPIYDASHANRYANIKYYSLNDIARDISPWCNSDAVIYSYLSTPHCWNIVTEWEHSNNHAFTSADGAADIINDAMTIGGPIDLHRWRTEAEGAAFKLCGRDVYAVKQVAMDFLYMIAPTIALNMLNDLESKATMYHLIE